MSHETGMHLLLLPKPGLLLQLAFQRIPCSLLSLDLAHGLARVLFSLLPAPQLRNRELLGNEHIMKWPQAVRLADQSQPAASANTCLMLQAGLRTSSAA